MPGMKFESQQKKANRHTPNRKLLVKTKTLLTFGMTLKTTHQKSPKPTAYKKSRL